MTAYHEHTHQKRAVINLTKASRLVDDKRTLVADPASPTKASGKGRRKSAFGEEDEGYQYVEEGFRVRFANGETIDFYADNRGRKEEWIAALSQVIGKADLGSDKKAAWTDLVLARERAQAGQPQSAPGSSDGSSSPVKASPVKAGGVEVRDFTKPPPAARQNSYRKPVGTPMSKSAPNSPMKSQAMRNAPMLPKAAPAARPKTPPMSGRTGHRSRNAVKSMIF